MTNELTLDGYDLAEFQRRMTTLSPIQQMTERLRLHLGLGGLVTDDVVRGCASRSGIDLEPWRWLESTDELQRESFGFDWDVLGRTPAKVAASLKDNIFALMVELAEASVEFSWKHWATDEPFVDRDRALAEFVDAGHFLANCLHALGVSDAEWEEAYRAKQDKNRRRMASGTYSARKGGLGEGSEVE